MNVKIHILRKILKDRRGFTLVETVIAIALVTVIGLVCAGMISFFARLTRDDTVNTCLLQAASSGIEAARANSTTNSITLPCGGYTINATIAYSGTLPNPAPAMGSGSSACVQVTATATIGSKTRVMRDLICNFPNN